MAASHASRVTFLVRFKFRVADLKELGTRCLRGGFPIGTPSLRKNACRGTEELLDESTDKEACIELGGETA